MGKYRKMTIKMTYEVIILGHLHMPLYFIGTFTEYSYLDWSTGKLWESLGDQDKARAYIGKVRLTGMSGSPKCADFRPVRIKIDD